MSQKGNFRKLGNPQVCWTPYLSGMHLLWLSKRFRAPAGNQKEIPLLLWRILISLGGGKEATLLLNGIACNGQLLASDVTVLEKKK